MSSRHLFLLGALVVGIALAVWLLAGGLGLGDGGAASHEGDGSGGASDLAAGEIDATSAAADAGEDEGPVLFGRPAAERVGRGGVHGKVLTAATNAPVADAKVLLTGQGFGGEDVAWRGRTDAGGGFRIAEVPAGDDYDLTLEAEGHPGRTVPGVSVRDGASSALGTLWLGTQVGLVGRVLDASGKGIPHAQVRLHAGHLSLLDVFGNLAELFSNLDREPEGLARTLTDRNGDFTFEAVDPGPLTMTVRAAGYEPAHREVVAAERIDETPVVVRLLKGMTVSGRVLDASGGGIPGARVAAVSGDDPLAFLFGRSFTETDVDGSFAVDASASTDEVMLLASAPGYAVCMHKVPPGSTGVTITLDHSATLVVRVLQASDSAPIEGASVMLGVQADEEQRGGDPDSIVSGTTDATGRFTADVSTGRIQMVMVSCADGRFGMWSGAAGPGVGAGSMLMEGPEDATVRSGRQEMDFRIQDSVLVEGTVRDEAGEPVVGARIMSGMGFQLARPVYTDEAGRYAIRQARGGFALLIVRADGFLPLQEVMRDLPEDGAAERDLTLKRAAIVTGRVLDAGGRPLPGARVRAKDVGENPGMAGMGFFGEAQGLTDGQGRYVIDGVAPGKAVRMMARHTAMTDGVSEPFAVGEGGSVRAPDVTLHPGRQVDIRVVDPGGHPVAGARVELSFDGREMPDWDTFDLFANDANLVTSEKGHVIAEQVPPCELTVTATHPDHARGRTVRTITDDATAPLHVEVALTVPARVAGRVVDAGGSPLEGVRVTAQLEGDDLSFQHAQTDADGRFAFERLPQGPFTLHANRAGYRALEKQYAAAGEDLVLTLEADDPATTARREALQQGLAKAFERLQQAKNDDERSAIAAEIQALSEELQALGEQGTGD